MKTLLVIFSVLVFSMSGYSQVFPLMPKYYRPLDSTVLAKDTEPDKGQKQTLMKQHEKISYSVAVGTGFSSFGNDMSMMSSYIAPTVNYRVNSKLNLTVNGVIMRNNYSGFEGLNSVSPSYSYNSNVSNYGISGMAHYQLSEKWSIWGDGAYFENQSIFNDYRAQMYDTDYKTVLVGVGYKINDKFQFNFQYRYSNGLDPAYNNISPFYNSVNRPYHSPYGLWNH